MTQPNPVSEQHHAYRRYLDAHELSSQDSLPDVKQKQREWSADSGAEVGLDGLAHVLEGAALISETSRAASFAPAAPFVAAGAYLYGIYSADKDGTEQSEALQRDVAHTVTLHMGRDAFGAEYAGYVEAEHARLRAEYEHDGSSHALYASTVERTVTAVIKAEGSNDKARAAVAAGVRDGIDFAKQLGLSSTADVDVMKNLNPSFRERYETDPTFHHGVDAVVWRASHPKTKP